MTLRKTRSQTRRYILLSLLLTAWLTALVWAFLAFELRFFSPPASQGVLRTFQFEETRLRSELRTLSGITPKNLVIHFWNPRCECSPMVQTHLSELLTLADERGLKSLVVINEAGTRSKDLIRTQAALAFGKDIEQLFAKVSKITPASPAAAVFDDSGQLTYFGPYSPAPDCNTEKSAFVEQAIQGKVELSGGRRLATACLCRWDESG